MKENSRKCEEPSLSDMATVPAIAMHSNSTAPLPETRNGYSDLLIKTEPESGGSTPACLQSPPLSSTSGTKAPPSSLPFAPSSSGSSNGRTNRNFSTPDAKRKCRQSTNSRSSPMFGGKDEIEDDDLKLNPDDFLSTVIRTPPIKPLEEGDDTPITPSPTSVGPPARRCPSNPPTNHSNSVSTSGPTATGSSNGISSNSNSSRMAEDLNEFYRVMEQVERLSSTLPVNSTGATSTRIDMYSSHMSPPNMVGTQHVISPPPYNSRIPLTAPSGNRYNSGHLPATLTSPSSPPFSTAHSLFGNSLRSQRAPSVSLAMQQSRPQPQQAYPSGPTSLTSSQVDASLQFSDPSLMSQSLTQQSHAHQPTQPQQQQQQQLQSASKPQTQAEAQPRQQQHRQMHLSHLNQCGDTTGQVVTPAPLNTSHVFYNSSQNQQQRMHPSASSLPPQPLTPTTPLEHYATFSTTQSTQISPTHGSNPLHHRTLPGTASYTYSSPETSHFLSNHVQNLYHQSAQQRQILQQHQQQSAAITVSTNSWSGQQQTPQLSNMMTPHAMGRNHVNSLGRPQRAEPSIASYPQLRMGHMSLQQHAPPPAYMQSCGTASHPTAAYSRLPFPPNMQ